MVQINKICCYIMIIMMVGSLTTAQEDLTGNEMTTLAPDKTEALDNVSQMTDIYDIKSMAQFGFNPAWIRYGLITLCFLMGIALLAVAVVYWKKRRPAVETVSAELLPEEIACRLIEEIKRLWDVDGKEYYFRLSAILRGYIHDRYGIEALEMTTQELLPQISELKLDADLKTGIKSFIDFSDPVKFAGIRADKEKMQDHYRFVKNFVKRTTPIMSVMERSTFDKTG